MQGVSEAAKAIENKIVEDRRYLHQNPEVGFNLPNTTAYVKRQLKALGIEPKDCGGPLNPEIRHKFMTVGFGDMEQSTGLVATIGSGSPCILLRADMDALPMRETTGLEFQSTKSMAHMCGHDSHIAMLLGAAKILKDREHELKGTVKLMFQPAEELGCGSKMMIMNGLLENPKVDAALAIHVMPDKEAGTVEYVKGITSASMDTFFVKIKGKGGHSSMPHKAIDPLMIMNQLYTAINLLPSREVDPQETVALTIGKGGGGTAANIIPDTAEMQIGVRTFNTEVREHLVRRIPEVIDHIIKAWRGEYELTIFHTPSTFNDADLCEELAPFVREVVGDRNVTEARRPMAGSEDFGYVSEQVPGVFVWLGAGKPGAYPVHNPNMTLNEGVFPTGSAILANCAIEWLAKNSK